MAEGLSLQPGGDKDTTEFALGGTGFWAGVYLPGVGLGQPSIVLGSPTAVLGTGILSGAARCFGTPRLVLCQQLQLTSSIFPASLSPPTPWGGHSSPVSPPGVVGLWLAGTCCGSSRAAAGPGPAKHLSSVCLKHPTSPGSRPALPRRREKEPFGDPELLG